MEVHKRSENRQLIQTGFHEGDGLRHVNVYKALEVQCSTMNLFKRGDFVKVVAWGDGR